MKNLDAIFEVSWEVCNKVGGINTVISTKAQSIINEIGDNLIMIGPDIWREKQQVSDFIEDPELLKEWRLQASTEGLEIRIGRWDIAGQPIAILLDFSSFFSQKDEIFGHLWEKYHLDSLNGQWDYIEPSIFGYAAGKLIASYHNYFLNAGSITIAHFHEWMTGSGILYLKENAPYVGTVFTTHATIMGRVLAGNEHPFYGHLHEYNPSMMSRKLGIRSKYSMEKLCAHEADAFTTVSDLTNVECKHLLEKEVDVVTPNGFEDMFVPDAANFAPARKAAQKKLKEVAKATLGYETSDNALYVINSGRYEYRNKGIDLFIDSLKELQEDPTLDREIVAFIMVPAHHKGPNMEVLNRLNGELSHTSSFSSTHLLHDPQNDPVLTKLNDLGLVNQKDSKVKVIFSPVYLDVNEPIYQMNYFDILIGFDVSVFASYYEPWGYTPMESLAFHIPTVTTNLAGFGLWLKEKAGDQKAAYVIDRSDDNNAEVVHDITKALRFYSDTEDMTPIRKKAFELSRLALWKELVQYYAKAYEIATSSAQQRIDNMESQVYHKPGKRFHEIEAQKDKWKKILVQQRLPKNLEPLEELSKNLWWTWNHDAAVVFKSIDPDLWEEHKFNPVSMIEALDTEKLKELESDKDFVTRLQKVYSEFQAYMAKKDEQDEDAIAYLSMEFGIHDTLKIFSGGLGILAGDYIKEASDANVNMIGIGLLYRQGYFRQRITMFGDQMAEFKAQRFSHMPIEPVRDENGDWKMVHISLPRRVLHAKIWRVPVGRVSLYLLDTDIDQNSMEDRRITHQLYGGGLENRFLQELLLGVGGIRLLEAIGAKPSLYHCNEGHAAMIGVERLRKYIQEENLNFEQAKELVRASTLFTTHTPVPAGHDRFEEDILRIFIPHYAERLQLSWDRFMDLGRVNIEDHTEKFSMSVLAAKLSLNMNGVSKIHGAVSRDMFREMYPGYYANELHISHVTNGVHLPSWTAKKWNQLYTEHIDKDFFTKQKDFKMWSKIYDVDNAKIWDLRNHMRAKLIEYLKYRLKDEMTSRMESPKEMLDTIYGLRSDVLTIGFARRFATYKRAHLLFSNLDILDSIINDPERPVQFIFAGKAHPADGAGQDLIKRVVEITKMPQFRGKVVFVENYDINLGKKLVQGVDVWLNNPTRPLEASGTSGEKAVMNGVLNLSVLDGWWAEGYKPGAGWALPEDRTYEDQGLQDGLDSASLYHLIQDELKPVFYTRTDAGVPNEWILMVKKNIAEIAPHFTMNRMLRDYQRQFYVPQIALFKDFSLNDNAEALAYRAWKDKVQEQWNNLELVEVRIPDATVKPLSMGENFKASLIFRLGALSIDDISVEIVFGKKEGEDIQEIIHVEEMKASAKKEGIVDFACDIPLSRAGVYDFAFRVYPKHPKMTHRMDFPLVKWI